MPKPTSYRFRLVYLLVFVLIFLVGFPVLVFYSTGYTIDDAFNLSTRGGIYVFMPEPNTSVFLGNELQNTSGFFNKEVLIDHLKPDRYLVLVTNDAYWPWAKFVNVKSQEVESLLPLLVPKVIEAEEIIADTDDYEDVLTLFSTFSEKKTAQVTSGSTTVPTVASSSLPASEIFSRRKVKIWLENNDIYAQWTGSNAAAPKYFCAESMVQKEKICTEPLMIFHSFVPITRIDFYPYRNDAVVLALDHGIYAVEIDSRVYQNFYPLYRGQQPDFRIDRNQMYIKDGNFLSLLKLEP